MVVVKDGGAGAVAMEPGSGSATREPAVPVEARDTTGAGDVFDAGFIYASLAGWPVSQRLRFANLCASESVKLIGGSFAAPCWRDLAAFWRGLDDLELRPGVQLPRRRNVECPRAPGLPALPSGHGASGRRGPSQPRRVDRRGRLDDLQSKVKPVNIIVPIIFVYF